MRKFPRAGPGNTDLFMTTFEFRWNSVERKTLLYFRVQMKIAICGYEGNGERDKPTSEFEIRLKKWPEVTDYRVSKKMASEY